MRDLEDIILGTMCIKLAEVTGIPTGRIFAKMPDIEYVNKYDGSKQPTTNKQIFPCIGMEYSDKVVYKVNRYGEEPLVIKNAIHSKIYEPMGEIHIPLYIHIFTNSRKEQRTLGTIISYEMSSNLYYNTLFDEIPNQYFSIEYHGFKDIETQSPFQRVICVTLCGQMFRETSGYLVETSIVNINTVSENQYIKPEADNFVDSAYEGILSNPDEIFTVASNEDYELLLFSSEDDVLLIPTEEE